jgi:ribose transport system substrate-binding protein
VRLSSTRLRIGRRRSRTAGLVLAAVALGTAACSSSSSSSSAKPTSSTPHSSYTIGFANPQGTQPVLDTFQQALTEAAKRQGITVTSLNAALSVSNQVSDIQQFINEKVKAIVVFPLAGPPLVPVLTAARKAGIVVLGYNAVTSSSAVTSAQALYPYNADINQGLIHEGAKLAADYVATALHGQGNVLGVDIAAPVPSLHAFIHAEEADVTADSSGIHWLETVHDQTDDIAGAAGPVADALTKYHNDVQAVMAYFDGAAEGSAQALKAAGVHAVVVGQQGNSDGIAAIRAGEMDATINELPYEQALIALKMVEDLVAGKSVPLVVHPPVQLVTKSNLSSYVPWSTGLKEVADGTLTPPATLSANPTFG